jgi:hypothetical protein
MMTNPPSGAGGWGSSLAPFSEKDFSEKKKLSLSLFLSLFLFSLASLASTASSNAALAGH